MNCMPVMSAYMKPAQAAPTSMAAAELPSRRWSWAHGCFVSQIARGHIVSRSAPCQNTGPLHDPVGVVAVRSQIIVRHDLWRRICAAGQHLHTREVGNAMFGFGDRPRCHHQ
jgi:hypothetical protein